MQLSHVEDHGLVRMFHPEEVGITRQCAKQLHIFEARDVVSALDLVWEAKRNNLVWK
jgi:hypothetical protein